MAAPDWEEVADELQVLQSILCQDGEFVLHHCSEPTRSAQYTLRVGSSDSQLPNRACNIDLTFTIGPSYPQCLPDIYLTSDLLTRKASDLMKIQLFEYANEHLVGEPMTLQIVEWVKLHFNEYANELQTMSQSHTSSDDQGGLTISLLRLDHMRARTRYIKTLKSWCAELCIMGNIFFVEKLILILLEGQHGNVKEFILRLKTQKVDVDSSGKPCKEKMMNVLSERHTDQHRFSSFEVAELGSIQSLKENFDAVNLMELYEQHVQPLLRHSTEGSVR